ncbi:MAG: hypothetical protein AB8B93_10255 [Pseudomonadales bacterium]
MTSLNPSPTELPAPAVGRPGELRFGALGLAQLLIGDALLVNSRCLRFLAQQRGPRAQAESAAGVVAGAGPVLPDSLLSDQEMQALRRSVVRLASHWQLLQRTELAGLAELGIARHRAVLALLPSGSPVGRAAKELLEQTEDPKGRAALREVMDQWLVSRRVRQVSGLDRDRLLELLEMDATAWQEAVDQVQPGSPAAILDGLRRCYRKPRRLAAALGASLQDNKVSDKQLLRLHQLVSRNVSQLELLRSGLSDQYAKQLWYLQRLERNLGRRLDLAAFEQKLYSMDLRTERLSKVQQRAQLAVRARAQVQAQRTGKLVELAYSNKPRAYAQGIGADLAAVSATALTLADSNLDQLADSLGDQSPLNLGDITVEEPRPR